MLMRQVASRNLHRWERQRMGFHAPRISPFCGDLAEGMSVGSATDTRARPCSLEALAAPHAH
jgi:hypothetical protein